ncbi:unnamed protein product [Leuciscus chuanchicus]
MELLDKGRSPSTLKVYVAAIAVFSSTTLGQSIGRNDLVIRFLRGAKRLNPPRPPTVPIWDLSTVLEAMKGHPFEPLQEIDLKHLSFKTPFLLALASVKRIGDLHALSHSPHVSDLMSYSSPQLLLYYTSTETVPDRTALYRTEQMFLYDLLTHGPHRLPAEE